MYNEALRPVHRMGKLGVVLFQFQVRRHTRLPLLTRTHRYPSNRANGRAPTSSSAERVRELLR